MNEIKYPQGCKDIQVDIPNDELIRRLTVSFFFFSRQNFFLFRHSYIFK
jgi:hypothetical protein